MPPDRPIRFFPPVKPWASLEAEGRALRIIRIIFGCILFTALLLFLFLMIGGLFAHTNEGQLVTLILCVPYLTILAWCVGGMFIWRRVHSPISPEEAVPQPKYIPQQRGGNQRTAPKPIRIRGCRPARHYRRTKGTGAGAATLRNKIILRHSSEGKGADCDSVSDHALRRLHRHADRSHGAGRVFLRASRRRHIVRGDDCGSQALIVIDSFPARGRMKKVMKWLLNSSLDFTPTINAGRCCECCHRLLRSCARSPVSRGGETHALSHGRCPKASAPFAGDPRRLLPMRHHPGPPFFSLAPGPRFV
jgi:hypothetical protein